MSDLPSPDGPFGLSILAMAFSGRLTNAVMGDINIPLFAPFARFWPPNRSQSLLLVNDVNRHKAREGRRGCQAAKHVIRDRPSGLRSTALRLAEREQASFRGRAGPSRSRRVSSCRVFF